MSKKQLKKMKQHNQKFETQDQSSPELGKQKKLGFSKYPAVDTTKKPQ